MTVISFGSLLHLDLGLLGVPSCLVFVSIEIIVTKIQRFFLSLSNLVLVTDCVVVIIRYLFVKLLVVTAQLRLEFLELTLILLCILVQHIVVHIYILTYLGLCSLDTCVLLKALLLGDLGFQFRLLRLLFILIKSFLKLSSVSSTLHATHQDQNEGKVQENNRSHDNQPDISVNTFNWLRFVDDNLLFLDRIRVIG